MTTHDETSRRFEPALAFHGLVVLVLTIMTSAGAPGRRTGALLLAAWGLVFFSVFFAAGQKVRPRPAADYITYARLLMGLGFYLAARAGRLGAPAALLWVLAMEIADGLDGWAARRWGPTAFGAAGDMESDAYVILLFSTAAVWFAGLPLWALVPGLIRYLFFFPFLVLKPRDAVFPKALSLYSKTVCVATVFCLASAWYLPKAATVAVAVASVLIVLSFLWETVFYVARRVHTRKR